MHLSIYCRFGERTKESCRGKWDQRDERLTVNAASAQDTARMLVQMRVEVEGVMLRSEMQQIPFIFCVFFILPEEHLIWTALNVS